MGRRSFRFRHTLEGSENNSEHESGAESTDEEREVMHRTKKGGRAKSQTPGNTLGSKGKTKSLTVCFNFSFAAINVGESGHQNDGC